MNNKYDVIIIGAGIGGLVCGNYLAKAGKRVLILEKNSLAGGCCSSFLDKNYLFDSGPHIITGALLNILKDIDVYEEKDFIKFNPLGTIFLEGRKYILPGDYKECRRYLKYKFPKDNVKGFFSLLDKNLIYLHAKLKNKNFADVLDEYFVTLEAKAILYGFVFCLGNLPEIISAIFALQYIKTMLIDGGFYPKGGMQNLSNKLVHKLSKNKGRVIFDTEVQGILTSKGKASGILDFNHKKFFADIAVSNISPINASKMLSGPGELSALLRGRKSDASFTDSCLVVHIALKEKIDIFDEKTSYTCIPNKDLRKNKRLYLLKSPRYKPMAFFISHNLSFPGDNYFKKHYSINLVAIIFHKPKSFWEKYKDAFADVMIEGLGKIVFNFKDKILFKKITTPYSIERFTGNNNGALGGWSLTPEHVIHKTFPYSSPIKNLYFAGHWTQSGEGISGAATSGKSVAELILRNKS